MKNHLNPTYSFHLDRLSQDTQRTDRLETGETKAGLTSNRENYAGQTKCRWWKLKTLQAGFNGATLMFLILSNVIDTLINTFSTFTLAISNENCINGFYEIYLDALASLAFKLSVRGACKCFDFFPDMGWPSALFPWRPVCNLRTTLCKLFCKQFTIFRPKRSDGRLNMSNGPTLCLNEIPFVKLSYCTFCLGLHWYCGNNPESPGWHSVTDTGDRITNDLKNWLWVCIRPLKILKLLIILFGVWTKNICDKNIQPLEGLDYG